MVQIICQECKETVEMPNRRFKMCSPCSKNRERERMKAYQKQFAKNRVSVASKKPSTEVAIVCKICSKTIIVPSKRFKMCGTCSRQKKLDRCRKYKAVNRERNTKYNREWKKEHKVEITIYNRRYERERKLTDLQFKLLRNVRTRLSQLVRKGVHGREHSETTKELIGIPLREFVDWLSQNFSGEMTLENYGEVWHVDHLLPCKWFDLTQENERKVCFHWLNMRPLEAGKNMGRGDSCNLRELLCQEISAKKFKKDIDFRPLVTKFWKKFQDGCSES